MALLPGTPTRRTRTATLTLGLLAGTLGLLLLGPGPADAHGDLESTIPKAGAEVKKPPDHLIINFTEPPTKSSIVKVQDGCRDQIVDELAFDDGVAHVFLDKGQPGKWKVSYDVVSSADGHKTDGSYGLTVPGETDCSQKPEGQGNGGDDGDGGTGSGPQAGGGGEDESSFPIVPVALGSVGVIALALIARRLSG